MLVVELNLSIVFVVFVLLDLCLFDCLFLLLASSRFFVYKMCIVCVCCKI